MRGFFRVFNGISNATIFNRMSSFVARVAQMKKLSSEDLACCRDAKVHSRKIAFAKMQSKSYNVRQRPRCKQENNVSSD